MNANTSTKDGQLTYDVAFSFAEEDRAFVDRVAEHLKSENVKFYYYSQELTTSWGKDLSNYLDQVYRTDARFCVIFVSKFYKTKRWSQHEWERAKARAFFMEHREYILPFRLDNTDIPGLDDSIAYLSRETHDEAQLAQAILDKIAQNKRKRFPQIQKLIGSPANVSKSAITALIAVFISLIGIIANQLVDKLPNNDRTTIPLFGSSVENENNRDQVIILPKVNKRWRFKAVCNDGWLSQSYGSGTCSHHKGIHHYVDTIVYGASVKECQQQAMQAFKNSQK